MFNHLILVGNLGNDPEMRYTPSGQAVCNFSMATTEKWTGQDGQMQERTLWWRVSMNCERSRMRRRTDSTIGTVASCHHSSL